MILWHHQQEQKVTVIGVDDIGSIIVNWDNGSSLSVVYGVYNCCVIQNEKNNGSMKINLDDIIKRLVQKLFIGDISYETYKNEERPDIEEIISHLEDK